MKHTIILGAALALALNHPAPGGTHLDDPSFDTMPTSGIAKFTSPAAEQALSLRISSENPHSGDGCLEISLPVEAYASVSFPLQNQSESESLQFSYRVEIGDESEVKIGIQSFTMDGGFKSVDFRPLIAPIQMGLEWRTFRGRIERAEGATHWQISVAINGPATVWLDQMEAQPE